VLRVCRSGLDVAELQRRILTALRGAMSIDAAFFATADPETLLFTGALSEDPLDGMTALFLDNELGGADVNTFTALARSPGHVASLDAVTRNQRMASARYRDIMRPVGLGDELRAALVTGGHCWGYLCLHREDGDLGFSPAEAALIRRLAPHIADALRQAAVLHSPGPDLPHRPGVVLLDEQMELIASTTEADALLPLIGHGSTRLPLPVGVYSVAAALSTVDRPPSMRVRATTGGWLHLHASRLPSASGAQIAVVLQPAEPKSTLGVVLAAHGLTARELDVARLVLRGRSTQAISAALHISAHTVQDHLKSVFDKVGVRSRRDLVSHLLGSQRS
jgi:DNA-binding CsgD family transcriptional regulator